MLNTEADPKNWAQSVGFCHPRFGEEVFEAVFRRIVAQC
jgi:hypothetical protein